MNRGTYVVGALLFAVVSATGCGAEKVIPQPIRASPPPELPATSSVVEYSCNAAAPSGHTFVAERTEARPFTVTFPRLDGWSDPSPTNNADTSDRLLSIVRRGPDQPGTFEQPVVTLVASAASESHSAEKVFRTRYKLINEQPEWKQARFDRVRVCGMDGIRVAGGWKLGADTVHQDYLVVAHPSETGLVSIELQTRTKNDGGVFDADIDKIMRGVQVER